MKKIFTCLLGWLGFLLLAQAQTEPCQNCATKGISTHPSNSVNAERPALRNTFFDWRTQRYTVNSTYVDDTSLKSPFFTADNLNVSHFLYNNDVHRPEDGWELIKHDMGYEVNGQPDRTGYIYLVLYNKHTGVLRVLLAGDDPDSYNGAEIEIKFDHRESKTLSSVISNASDMFALDIFRANPSIASASRYLNDITNWFYADFMTSYDPCTCYFESALAIEVRLIENSDIKLNGKLTGEIASINNRTNGAVRQNGFSFDASKAASVGKAAYKAYKDGSQWEDDQLKQAMTNAPHYDDLIAPYFKANNIATSELSSQQLRQSIIDYANAHAHIQQAQEAKQYIENNYKKVEKKVGLLEGLLSKSDLLRNGLKAVPYIGAALQFVRAFVGGGKQSSAPQTVQLTPMSINAEISLTGTISAQKIYKDIAFSTPGSLKSKCVTNDLYPYYNEVLGVINLLNTPEARVKEEVSYSDWVDEYGPQYEERRTFQVQLTNLDYVLNPASGLRSDNIELIGSLIFKNSPTGPTVYETSVMPIQTLLSTKAELGYRLTQGLFNETYPLDCGYYAPYIEVKLIVNLTRNNAGSNTQNVLWVGTYPVKTLDGTYFTFSSTAHCSIPKEVTLQGINVAGGASIRAWETVTIGSNVNFATNQRITIRAPEIVVNSTLPPNVVLVRDYPIAGSLYKAPVTDATVIRNFCNSNKYNPVARAASRVADGELEQENDETSIFDQAVLYPNPASGTTHLAFTLDRPTAVNILLMDLGGKVFYQTGEQPFDVGSHELPLEISGIPKGIYLVRIESPETRKTLKLVINE